jgi:malonate decarboxylase delta subunit
METLNFVYPASQPVSGRAHIGVVGSGDLEVLLEPSPDDQAHVTVRTSVDGFGEIWEAVLDRFFVRNDLAAAVEINDSGATPGTVSLRLAQAVEESRA